MNEIVDIAVSAETEDLTAAAAHSALNSATAHSAINSDLWLIVVGLKHVWPIDLSWGIIRDLTGDTKKP